MSEEIRPNFSRVSEILSMYSDYDSISPLVLDKAAERGSEIHGLCQLYAEDGIRLPSPHNGYVEGFIKWFDREVEECLQLEQRLYCDTYEITGQFDMLVRLKTKQLFIVDIKTCAAKHDTWPLQLAAYAYLLGEHQKRDHKFYNRAVLHLKKDGKYGFYDYPRREADMDLFMSALKLHRFFKKG